MIPARADMIDADAAAREAGSVHALAVKRELDWLTAVIETRLEILFTDQAGSGPLVPPPTLDPASALGQLVADVSLSTDDRIVLALSLAPQIRPALLDPFFLNNTALDRPFSEFGGQFSAQTGGFQPTGETALFLLAGTDMSARAQGLGVFASHEPLKRARLITLDAASAGAPALSGLLTPAAGLAERLLTGAEGKPDHEPGFPAQRLHTRLAWHDLVLAPEVMDQVEHIAAWVCHEGRILRDWGLERALKPGYRALFFGPPGTGKTLTAALLGQRAGADVYRVDLSMVVSKYIGETEKNLARLFDQAANQNWILFFDEADALFGARTATASSHDRYANQEVAYLLQRVEDCPCLVILATNLRDNIDAAFLRRFQSIVGFTRPSALERERLWAGVLGETVPMESDVSLPDLARDHDLAGGSILNVVRHAAVSALRRGADRVASADLQAGIVSEARKEGRIP
ncbi:MAG: ATP-binding protein [Pseudomonadota bacterium]